MRRLVVWQTFNTASDETVASIFTEENLANLYHTTRSHNRNRIIFMPYQVP
jgi:hypothetical protein